MPEWSRQGGETLCGTIKLRLKDEKEPARLTLGKRAFQTPCTQHFWKSWVKIVCPVHKSPKGSWSLVNRVEIREEGESEEVGQGQLL